MQMHRAKAPGSAPLPHLPHLLRLSSAGAALVATLHLTPRHPVPQRTLGTPGIEFQRLCNVRDFVDTAVSLGFLAGPFRCGPCSHRSGSSMGGHSSRQEAWIHEDMQTTCIPSRCTGMYIADRHTYVLTHMIEIMGRDICQSDLDMSQQASIMVQVE